MAKTSLTGAVLDGKRTPVNVTAGRVLAGGNHWQGQAMEGSRDSENPIPTYPVREWMAVSPKMVDLTGRKVGSLTVLGFGGKKRWVCRCSCGMYTLRSAKGLTNPSNNEDSCDHCYRKRRMEWHDRHRNRPATREQGER